MTKTSNQFAMLAGLLLALVTTVHADSFLVTLDTTPLSGAQTLGFGLNNSDSASNTVTLTGFLFGGGSATSGTANCTFLGASGTGCSGDLTNGITLQDLDTVVGFSQQFTAGSALSFLLTTTNNFSAAPPDTFAMYVCDGSVSVCYSDAATGAMLSLDLTGAALSPSSFTLSGAVEQQLDAPVVTDAVPEPGSLVVLAAGLAGMFAIRKRQQAS